MSHLPKFPTEALPDVIRAWVEAEAHATQTPADLAAWGALSVLASRVARRVVIEPRPGWIEPTNIYSVVLLGPGNRKSAVFNDATRPLRQIERELVEEAKPIVAREKSRRRQAEARLKKLETALSAGHDAETRHEADKIAEELAQEVEPHLPVLLVDDCTSEKLAAILASQQGRVMSASPEGGVFDLMAGRYSKSHQLDFDVYLKGHAGDDHVCHRISREPIHVERATITAFYAIQPQVIQAIVGNDAFRGRGLLARFAYAVPESQIGRRAVGTAPVSREITDNYHQLVREIGNFDGDHVMTLGTNVEALLLEWEAEIESMLDEGGEMDHIRDWGAKLAGLTIRLAAIITVSKHGVDMPLGLSSLKSAIKIARYLIPHAKHVLCEMAETDDGLTEQEKLIGWIKSRGGEASIRDLSHSGPRQYRRKVVEAEFALNDLRDNGHGDWVFLRPDAQGGRPTRVFRLWTSGPGTKTPDFPANGEVSVPEPSAAIQNHGTNGHDLDAVNLMFDQCVEWEEPA